MLLDDSQGLSAGSIEKWGTYPTMHVEDVGKAIDVAEKLGGKVKTSVLIFPEPPEMRIY